MARLQEEGERRRKQALGAAGGDGISSSWSAGPPSTFLIFLLSRSGRPPAKCAAALSPVSPTPVDALLSLYPCLLPDGTLLAGVGGSSYCFFASQPRRHPASRFFPFPFLFVFFFPRSPSLSTLMGRSPLPVRPPTSCPLQLPDVFPVFRPPPPISLLLSAFLPPSPLPRLCSGRLALWCGSSGAGSEGVMGICG